MFDFERAKPLIAEHFFKVLRTSEKTEDIQSFITRYLNWINSYCQQDGGFIGFDPSLPVPHHLVFRAQALLIVPFSNSKPSYVPPHTSVFPLYPFRVVLQKDNAPCEDSLTFLTLYLEIMDIRLVGLYRMKMHQQAKITAHLKETFPDIEVYGSNSFSYFKQRVLNKRMVR